MRSRGTRLGDEAEFWVQRHSGAEQSVLNVPAKAPPLFLCGALSLGFNLWLCERALCELQLEVWVATDYQRRYTGTSTFTFFVTRID